MTISKDLTSLSVNPNVIIRDLEVFALEVNCCPRKLPSLVLGLWSGVNDLNHLINHAIKKKIKTSHSPCFKLDYFVFKVW